MQIKTFQDLLVWQKAHQAVLKIYELTKSYPKEETYGLVSQIRRAASSIATNIVEGCKRRGQKEFAHFLNIAETSLEETKYHLILSKDLKYISMDQYNSLFSDYEEIGRMLNGLQKSIRD